MDINSIEKMYLKNGYVVLRDFLPKKVLEKFKNSLSGHISNQLSKHGLENTVKYCRPCRPLFRKHKKNGEKPCEEFLSILYVSSSSNCKDEIFSIYQSVKAIS